MMSITGLTVSSTPSPPSHELDDALEKIARSASLLVASDYDGTIAPLVVDPASARPNRESLVALRELAALPQTHVAVISGRALSELDRLLGSPDRVHLVGSHGSEFDLNFATSLPEQAVQTRGRIHEQLQTNAGRGPGFTLEIKPSSDAFHSRNST